MTETTTPVTTTRKAGVLIRVGAVLAALLAITDVVTAIPYMGDPMPVEIGVAIIVIAVLTVVGAVFAFLGRTWGVWLAVVTRFLSIAPMIPVFTEPGAPADAVLPVTIQIVVTVVVIVLLLVGLARRRAA
jgi:hypothetical protein